MIRTLILRIADKPQDDASAASEDTLYFDANDDTPRPYFLTGTEPPPREQWDVAEPIDFQDVQGVVYLSHQLDAAFQSTKEIETPLGMDDTKQMWRWADVGSCQMPRAPPMYPTLRWERVALINQWPTKSTIGLFSGGLLTTCHGSPNMSQFVQTQAWIKYTTHGLVPLSLKPCAWLTLR